MQFIDFAHSSGLIIKDLYASDRIHRCATVEHPHKKNGAYFWDGQRGWVCNWEADGQTRWFYTDKPWTEAEKDTWKRKQQANYEQIERKYAQAAHRAAEILKTAKPARHDYLHLKGLPEEIGLVIPDGALVIPMRNVRTNELQGLQFIRWVDAAWEKKMLVGMRAKGGVFKMGAANASETILCEGYATGLSIAAAARSVGLRLAVVVCFSASNMVHVAGMVPGKCYVYADNDVSHTGEDAAIQTGLPYCMSGIEGNDANDDQKQLGLIAVARKLMDVRLAEVRRC